MKETNSKSCDNCEFGYESGCLDCGKKKLCYIQPQPVDRSKRWLVACGSWTPDEEQKAKDKTRADNEQRKKKEKSLRFGHRWQLQTCNRCARLGETSTNQHGAICGHCSLFDDSRCINSTGCKIWTPKTPGEVKDLVEDFMARVRESIIVEKEEGK